MTATKQATGKEKRRRRPVQLRELLSLGLFAFATLMMTADFVVVEAGRPLNDLPTIAPWYLSGLPLIGLIFMVVCWLAFRRRLGAWVPLLAYLMFMGLSVSVDWHAIMEKRVESMELTKPMDYAEIAALEGFVAERIYIKGSFGDSRKLIVRRDPQVHDRAVRWLRENGR